MIELEKFQKHVVLYCKGQYKHPKGEKGFFEGLKRIWAIRCGYDHEFTSKDVLGYIANDMYSIISKCLPHMIPNIMDKIHRGVTSWSVPEGFTPIEAIIWEYRSILQGMQVKELVNNEYEWIIYLGEPQEELFNKIISGNGIYSDYEKVI